MFSTAGGATVGNKTYYAWGGSSVIAEYTEAAAATTMSWAKSYVYAGSRLLSTIKKNGTAETTEYHHPDRLGTKLVTNTAANTAKSQSSLPFGTAISSETQADTNQKFTSYDRSGATGLDYAVNRTYNSGQSRFTQVDPIGMASAGIGNPQSMNLFAYVTNDPVGFVDPSGLCSINISIFNRIGDVENSRTKRYGSDRTLEAARLEIARILGQAGISVTFDSENFDQIYAQNFTSILNSDAGRGLANTMEPFSSRSKVFAVTLSHKIPWSTSYSTQGRVLGRIIAHEVVAHTILGLENGTGPGQHTADGLTQATFDLFDLTSESTADLFLIPQSVIPLLLRLCNIPKPLKGNDSPGGGFGIPMRPSRPGGGGGGGGGDDPFRSASWLAFMAWANEGTVTVSFDDSSISIRIL